MPSIQEFKKTKKLDKTSKTHLSAKKTTVAVQKAKRRPGRETGDTRETFKMHEESKAAPKTEAQKEMNMNTHDETPKSSSEPHVEEKTKAEKTKVEIVFPGSEILRAKLPRPFDVAEKVATDWMNDGNFEGLPLGHPLAQELAAQGLKKAKEVEKKVIASGVVEKVATQALTWGMKASQEFNTIREQVKSKLGKK